MRLWLKSFVVLPIAALSVLTCGAGTCRADPPTAQQQQIFTDLDAADRDAYRTYDRDTMVDPADRAALGKTVGPAIQHHLDVLQQWMQAAPFDNTNSYELETVDLAMLALYGDAKAQTILQNAASGGDAEQAVCGKAGLLMKDWWTRPDAQEQLKDIRQFTELAQANPQNDELVGLVLDVARWGAASDDVAGKARNIAELILNGKAAKAYQARPDKIGMPFVFTGKTTAGKAFSTADWKGEVVVIDFWATWCPPCVAGLPDLAKLYQENHDKGLEIIGISNDDRLSDLKGFLKNHKDVVWPEIFAADKGDELNAISKKYNVASIPTTYVIERDGILRTIDMGRFPEELTLKFLDKKAQAGATTMP